MSTIHGFELVRETDVPEINSHVRLFRHVRTGLELLSVENDDENKCFGVNFVTPPDDSTGLPHILEHSVLNGSRKYPVKDPFKQLLKGSQATFINAMTAADKTMYPVASQNLQDFYNLIDVYMDAVFYPRITPEILQQEGWHYELDDLDAELTYKGVVFNEMKGAYSSPERLMYVVTKEALYPDTTYGVDSGGDPEVIPNLTYEKFKRFHETYYHPSNARVFFSGDDDPDTRLKLVDDFISEYDRLDVDAQIALQARFDEPTRHARGYDAGDDTEKKGRVTVNWMLVEPYTDEERTLALNILEHILLGTPAAPLRKALLDSGLGENLTGFGLQDSMKQMMFSTGLRGIDPMDADKVEALIFDTLRDLADNGIDPATIEASLNTIEFQMREYNTGNFPRGLAMMFGALNTWVFGGDPIAALAFEAPLNAVKERIAGGEKLFESLIREHLLDNTHRSTVVLEPDTEIRKRTVEKEKTRLEAARAAMSPGDLARVVENTKLLREMQNTPDTPEALATIPSLSVDDLPREIRTVPREVIADGGVTTLYHDLFTNGIAYVDVGFNMQALPADLLPYVPLFSRSLLELGTTEQDFIKLSQRIGSKTGGISPTRYLSEINHSDDHTAWFFVRGKATMDNTAEMLDIFRDILLTTNFDNPERFKQLALKAKASAESSVVNGGIGTIRSRLGARFNLTGWAGEQMDGVTNLFFLRDLVKQLESDWSGVLEKLHAIRDHLFNRDAMLVNVTLDADNWQTLQPQLQGFADSLPAKGQQTVTWEADLLTGNEGLSAPSQINFVGMQGNLYDLGYQKHGSIYVVLKAMRLDYIWEMIRVQGGAYGGTALFDSLSGAYGYLSWRDPNLTGTLANFKGAADYLRTTEVTDDTLTRAIVGTIGDMDGYQLPDAKGWSDLQRYLTGISDEERQQTRDEVFATTSAHFRQLGDLLAEYNQHAVAVALGSAEALEKANEEQPGLFTITKVL